MPSVWITANAGSGKTTYLTARVMTLLLMGVLPERICCITYTKAAASEMRHRVLKQLRELLLMDDTACAARIEELLGRKATADDLVRARSLFGLVLDSPTGGLQLTTIHGFCQNILRRFPLEAGVSPHFTVLEEGAADRLVNIERNRLLKEYEGDIPTLTEALEIIATNASETRFDGFIPAIIASRSAWEEVWRNQSPESLRRKILALHGLEEGVTRASLGEFILDCINDADSAICREHLDALVGGDNKDGQKLGRALTAWLEVEREHRTTLIDDLCGAFLTNEGEPRKKLYGKNQFPPTSKLHECCARIMAQIQRYSQRQAALANAEESMAMAALAREFLVRYRRAKEQAHALDYDDLIGKTQELFANPQLLGHVMSRLDHRIDHLLIDEAQDTSADQWRISKLLVDELIATNDGVGSGNVPRSLLVVGDEKQSIYSFQGARPELFARMEQEFHGLLKDSYSPLEPDALSNSYRSTEVVLTLVDHIAAREDMASQLSMSGKIERHILTRDAAAGSVALYAPVTAPEKFETPALTMPQEYHLEQTASQQLADRIAENIKQWLQEGRLIEDKETNGTRPIEAGDILILVRTRTTMVLPLIRTLERNHIPVAGLDRLTLSEHLAVRDLLALMQFTLNPADDLALAQVLRSPLIGISDEELRMLCVSRAGTLIAQLGEHPLLDEALSNRDGTPYEFLSLILESKGTRRVFAERFGEEVHEVLDELKAQAMMMPQGLAPTLTNFHDWMSASERQIKREQEAKGTRVRIMTVHGAKGLEAPVVILADTSTVPTTQNEKFFFTQDANTQPLPVLAISEDAKRAPVLVNAKQEKSDSIKAEYYRLLYVALTRARDELHIFGIANKKGEVKKGSWYEVIRDAMQALGAAEEGDKHVLRSDQSAMKTTTTNEKAPRASLPAWANAAAPQLKIKDTLSPSRLADEATASPYVDSDGSERARGVRIHRILELIEKDSDTVTIDRLAKIIAPEWEEGERHGITQRIAELLNAENWIWAMPSHAEVNIGGVVEMNGIQEPFSGQIDRLIETPTELVILDYKTGRHVPATAAEISETYRMQLKSYHALISKLRSDKPVRCAILWTATAQLMWCDAEVAATPWKNAAAA